MKRNLLFSFFSLFLPGLAFSSPLIPREDLFRPSACLSIKISPDGKRLAYVGADQTGTTNLFVTSTLSLETAERLTHFEDPEITVFHWTADSEHILFQKDTNGTRQFHLYCLNVTTKELQPLTAAYPKTNPKIFQLSPSENKAVIGINARTPHYHDLYLLNLTDNSLTPFFENNAYINFLFDDNLNIVLKVRLNPDSSLTYVDHNDQILFTANAEDAMQTEFLKYNEEENAFYLLDNRNSNTTVLKKIQNHPNSTKGLALGHDSHSDIHDVIFEEKKPIAYSTYYTQKKWHALSKTTDTTFSFLTAKIGPDFCIASYSRDNNFWILKNNIAERGIEFWLYDRTLHTLTCLREASSKPLANMYPLVIHSSDGKNLVCYLTIPRDLDLGGKPKYALPLVVTPHGGPFNARNYRHFDPRHQWLANRGYAVLSVNFRLSSGFGKDFVSAGDKQWGKKAHQDVIDAVNYCIGAGIAQKDKVAIFGGSYGGYETLAALTFSPKTFACGISLCGPSDLKTVLKNCPFYWEFPSPVVPNKTIFFTKNAFRKSIGGDPDKETDYLFLRSCSPLYHASKIEKPLLLVHGANDPIVTAAESDQIFAALKKNNQSALYLSFPDEGHGVTKTPNLQTYLAYSEWLLAEVLGGRCEPINTSLLQQSSVHIQSHNLQPTSAPQNR